MNHTVILVPLSLADGRDHAFEHGVDLATATGAELHLLHAVPADLPFSFQAAERRRHLVTLVGRAKSAGLTVRVVERHGDPADVIARYANAQVADLVVLGSARRTGWARWQRPSVAERVLRRSLRPTLVVPRDARVGAGRERVLVAVDRVRSLPALLAAALALDPVRAPRLSVMHVVGSLEAEGAVSHPARWLVPEVREHVLDAARREIERALPPGVEAPVHVATGSTAPAIESRAAALGADLVVVGASQRVWHVGSTAARLLRGGRFPLLVVPVAAMVHAIDDDGSTHTRAA